MEMVPSTSGSHADDWRIGKGHEKSSSDTVKVRKATRFMCKTKEELLAANPSIKDGLAPDKEKLWRRQYALMITEAGIQLRIPQWGIAVGVQLCHRFFAIKSMKRNDRFLIATACLFLAAKVEESPKPLKAVITEMEKLKHKDLSRLRYLEDPAHLERCKEEVLQAERAVLYTLGFDLHLPHPYKPLLQRLSELQLLNLAEDDPVKDLLQAAWNIIGDSVRTTLCLQYEPEKIAFACLYLADQRFAGKQSIKERLPVDPITKKPNDFYDYFQLNRAQIEDIQAQILGEYEHCKLSHIAMQSAEPITQVIEAHAGVGLPPAAAAFSAVGQHVDMAGALQTMMHGRADGAVKLEAMDDGMDMG